MDPQTVQHFMKLALEEAERALLIEEVPIGCVIVRNGIVIAKGREVSSKETILNATGSNRTNLQRNATRHAEMEALDVLSTPFSDLNLQDCILFVTCEPCIMCAAALSFAKIGYHC